VSRPDGDDLRSLVDHRRYSGRPGVNVEGKQRAANMKSHVPGSMLRRGSLLFWCTLVVPVAIIAIGINFILNPAGASAGFGIPIHDPTVFPFMWTKGIRDIFSGLVVLPFLLKADRPATATLFAISIVARSAMGSSSCDIWALRHPSIFTGERRST
jgi:Domain of unknown function (DUF4267)